MLAEGLLVELSVSPSLKFVMELAGKMMLLSPRKTMKHYMTLEAKPISRTSLDGSSYTSFNLICLLFYIYIHLGKEIKVRSCTPTERLPGQLL